MRLILRRETEDDPTVVPFPSLDLSPSRSVLVSTGTHPDVSGTTVDSPPQVEIFVSTTLEREVSPAPGDHTSQEDP